MINWGKRMPLKLILLEHLVEMNKKFGMNFININDLVNIAKHPDINIMDRNDVLLFLRFQHNIGNIIFFDDIPDLIILNPQWLVDAFRCLVSDRIDPTLLHRADCTKFEHSGQISESLMIELFKSKHRSDFSGQSTELLEVMKKFDILVEVENTRSYIVPSMMPSLSFDEICKRIGVLQTSCKRTSWLCLKFDFLPPAFFNHISVWFIKKYKPSKVNNEIGSLALFRGICVFDTDDSGCEKLLVTMSTNTIALQLLSFATRKTEFGSMCVNLLSGISRHTEVIKKRYRLEICYELHFKCSTGDFYNDTKSFTDLKKYKEYKCNQHDETHESEEVYLPWMLNEVSFENIAVIEMTYILYG